MPELPEVETTRRGLEPYLLGRRVEEVEIRRRDLRWPIPDNFEELIESQCFTGTARRGKYLILNLEKGWSILAHLGMSGTFRVESCWPEEPRKHDHMILALDSGEALIFHDPRRFGFILPVESVNLHEHPRLKEMGPDPFDENAFTAAYLQVTLACRSAAIKPALLDQTLVAGVGNIYASEVLFEAGISPLKPCNQLKIKEIKRLILTLRKVLAAAIASGGSTLRDFSGAGGEAGYFQHAFKVYERAGDPCVKCQKPLQVAVQSGRSTYLCIKCQK